jgi:hemolysin activation/secretion protein
MRSQKLSLTLMALAASSAFAQVPPSPTAPAPAAPTTPAAAEAFELREVRFAPTEAVDTASLQGVAARYLGRRMGQTELNALSRELQQLYEERGFGLAAVGFPSQKLGDGVLQVAIVEPRLGRATIASSSSVRFGEDRVKALLAHVRVVPGQPLNLRALDRAMFALNDLPGIGAKANIVSSGDEGVFDLSIELSPKKEFEAAVELDNHGNTSTGAIRLGGLARWNNPTGVGDNLDLRVMRSGSSGLTLGRIAYERPLGATTARATVGLSRVSYVLGGSFEGLQANGVATVADAAVSYPLVRSRNRNLIVRAGLEDKRLDDRFDAFDFRTDKHIRNALLGASFEGNDTWAGGGYTGAALQLQWGHLRIDTANVQAEDAALGGQATQGRFEKLTLQASRLQTLAPRFSAFAGVSAQWASRNLDGAERLTLGGAHAVRAYAGSEAPSDQGMVINAELRWFLSPRWTVFALHDWARGELRKRPDPGEANVRLLRGSGVGLYFSDPAWFTLSATLAWRGNERPAALADDHRPRLYVQLQRPF